jgi:uncharacterized protein
VKILVDILHPAHVHFFKHPIWSWQEKGYEVEITLRDKDIARELLDRYGFRYHNLGSAKANLAGWGLELISRNLRLWQIMRRFKPDVLIGIAGISIAQMGWLKHIPSLVFTDTENATLSNRLTFPFATVVCTPDCFEAPVRAHKHVTYPGYHELSYMHPNHFKPDPACLRQFGLQSGENFIVMRLVAWKAAHDLSDRGFNNVRQVIETLSRYGRVLITSEAELPADLASYRITTSLEQIHHLLYYANLFIGESATMASECAILGTPAIFVSTSTRGYTDDQERKYNLVYTFSDPNNREQQALKQAVTILDDPKSKEKWQAKRDRMLADKIDVAQFIMDIVEEYGRKG